MSSSYSFVFFTFIGNHITTTIQITQFVQLTLLTTTSLLFSFVFKFGESNWKQTVFFFMISQNKQLQLNLVHLPLWLNLKWWILTRNWSGGMLCCEHTSLNGGNPNISSSWWWERIWSCFSSSLFLFIFSYWEGGKPQTMPFFQIRGGWAL